MGKYFRLNRKQKEKVVDYLEELCETSRISKKTLGQTIRSYHVSLPFVVIILFGTQLTVSIAAINLFVVFILFFISNGCLLTMLEHRLCGDEFTIADPFIETFGMESTSANRILISYFIAIGFFIFFFIVYYFRFYYKSKIVNVITTIAATIATNTVLDDLGEEITKM